MLTRPESCLGCPLHDKHIGIGFMAPEGLASAGVLVLGEALGAHEASDGLPFRPNAPAGSVFAGLIRRIPGLQRQDLLISNTIWCQPGKSNWLSGAPYEHAAIAHCQQYNNDLIVQRKPKVVLTLGAIPTSTVTGLSGYNQGIKLLRGFVLEAKHPAYVDADGRPLLVVPSYHPSFLLRASKTRSKDKEGGGTGAKVEKAEGGMALSGVVTRDIQLALAVAKGQYPGRHQFESIHASREVMDEYYRFLLAHPELPIGWDIETPRSISMADDESEIDSIQADVTQIQFATDRKKGYVIPGGFKSAWGKEISRKILALPNTKYSWNGWKFDNKVVVGHHGLVIGGLDIDLMKAWHWIQPDLPQGLQYATSFYAPQLHPWKHLASEGFDSSWESYHENMDTYGACDVISLHFNAEGIFDVMQSRGLRTSFDRHVLMLNKELVAASHRGLPINPVKHLAFGLEVGKEQDKLGVEIRSVIPEEVLTMHPKPDKKKKQVGFGYVGIPKQIAEFLDENGNPKDGEDNVVLSEEVTEDVFNEETEEITQETTIEKVVYTRRLVPVFSKETLAEEPTLRWVKLLPFSHNSGPQIKKYILFRREEEIARRLSKGQAKHDAERLAKYKIPQVRNKQKEMKDNTGSKELQKLFKETGDKVFALIVDVKKLNKLYGTYYKGWQTTRNGQPVSPDYVHTTFGPADTGTGQLSSTDPNIQNAPKHSNLAKKFRETIEAKPGKILLEFDKKSFHAQTLAWLAKDKAYARLAAIDVHSYMTAHRLKLPEASQMLSWSDKDMKAWIDERKADPFIYKAEAVPNIPQGLTFQQVRDYKSKRVILGLGFAQGARSIFEQNPESYKDAKEVQSFIDVLWGIFPEVKIFHKAITQQAHRDTYLISDWGYIRRFFDVFQWDSTKWNAFSGSSGDWRQGDDFESAIAFLPANVAFGMIKEEMLRLAGYNPDFISDFKKYNEDLLEKYGFVNQVHDSLVFHCDIALKDECIENVFKVMRQPCPKIYFPGQEDAGLAAWTKDGLFVDAEVAVGPDWAHMKALKGV
jgi:uracil-DNA glycosylase family 4